MTDQRRSYKTKQRGLISSYMSKNAERYLSVDDVWAGVSSEGVGVGRSTVYRFLEGMAADGSAFKTTSPKGEARYRMSTTDSSSQLLCLECGRTLPLDCQMVVDFSAHVLDQHSFKIDPARTVIYGLCDNCMEEKL